MASDVLDFEVECNPNLTRREYALEVLAQAQQRVTLTAAIENRARTLQTFGVHPLDALHLAAAEAATADYFCTCDDKLLRRAREIKDLQIKVVSPLELIQEIER